MAGINQQADIVCRAEPGHRSRIQRPGDMRSVQALNLLQSIPGGIPIGRARRIRHADREPSLCRSTENQDHLRKRCLNSWA